MPALSAMTEQGLELVEQFPAFMREDPHVLAMCHVRAKETEYILAKMDELRDGMIPVRAGDVLMALWEAQVHLPQNPVGKTIEERRNAVLARIQSFLADPAGSAWVANIRQQIGIGWTYIEEQPHLLRFTVPWPPGSEGFVRAQQVINTERPAAWAFIVSYEAGFILDLSQLDLEAFHSDTNSAELTAEDIERGDEAMTWLRSMTGSRTTVVTESTIALDESYSPSDVGAISGTFELEGRSFDTAPMSIEVFTPDPLEDSYRGVVTGHVLETPDPGRWIIQAYKRVDGVISEVAVQTLADGTTGNFSIDLTGVSIGIPGEWMFGLLDADDSYAQYGTKWPDTVYEGLEVQHFIITDTDYYWSTAPANTNGTFFFPNSNTGRKVARLVDTTTDPDEILAEFTDITGLLRSYEYEPDEDGYGTALEDQCYVYDQGLAIVAAVGENDEAFAKQLVDGLLLMMTPPGDDYEGGFVFAAPQLSPAYRSPMYRTGAHAIATDALLIYMGAYPGDPDMSTYVEAAESALAFIDGTLSAEEPTAGLYLGGYGTYVGDPEEFDPESVIEWASCEHNIDIWQVFVRAAEVLDDPSWQEKADDLDAVIMEKLWNEADERLNQGVQSGGPDTADPLDVNSWGAIQLLGAGHPDEAEAALDRVTLFESQSGSIEGYAPFYDSEGYPGAIETVWFEGSFGVALAQYRLGRFAAYRSTLEGLDHAQETDGSWRYATEQDETYGIGRSRSVAGTAWWCIATTGRDVLWPVEG